LLSAQEQERSQKITRGRVMGFRPSRRAELALLGVFAALLMPGVASAQFSDSYNFLKAVKDRDGNKATEIISKPGSGSVIIDTKDREKGETALHLVTRGRDLLWMNFLLGKGAKADVRDNEGNSPLMIATQLRFVEGVQALLNNRANVNLANSSGETPLIRAVQQRDLVLVRLLLNAGANADKADTIAGLSAREYAKRDVRGAAILKIIDEPRAKPTGKVAGPKL
jgi:uncharacterized protein